MKRHALREIISSNLGNTSYFVAGLASMAIGAGLHFNIDAKFQTCDTENISCSFGEETLVEDIGIIGGLAMSGGALLYMVIPEDRQ